MPRTHDDAIRQSLNNPSPEQSAAFLRLLRRTIEARQPLFWSDCYSLEQIARLLDVVAITPRPKDIEEALEKCREWALTDEEVEELLR